MSLIAKMGLAIQRIYQKFLGKLNSLKGSPKEISKGFATGAAVSFTPFVGFHLLICLLVSKITRQNGIAAVLGTIVGNPWTFPFIWYATLKTGQFVLKNELTEVPISFKKLFSELFHAVISLDFSAFMTDIWPVFLPMMVGCVPFYIAVWWLTYRVVLHILTLPPAIKKKG